MQNKFSLKNERHLFHRYIRKKGFATHFKAIFVQVDMKSISLTGCSILPCWNNISLTISAKYSTDQCENDINKSCENILLSGSCDSPTT